MLIEKYDQVRPFKHLFMTIYRTRECLSDMIFEWRLSLKLVELFDVTTGAWKCRPGNINRLSAENIDKAWRIINFTEFLTDVIIGGFQNCGSSILNERFLFFNLSFSFQNPGWTVKVTESFGRFEFSNAITKISV